MADRRPARAVWMGLLTALGWARRGFFIPYRYAPNLPGSGEIPTYTEIESNFADSMPSMANLLDEMRGMADALLAIGPDEPPQPRWNQQWFPGLDGAAAYALTRRHAPSRIVEVGSGHSTRFFARAIRDGNLKTEITAIDPAPRASLEGLSIDLVQAPVHQADPEIFAGLRSGGFLFIDSSHILMPGTDVDWLFSRILPALPEGVYVHIHDIFLPDDYPADWAWRGYNEQQGVAALIQGGAFEIEFSSHFVRTRNPDLLTGSPFGHIAPVAGAVESSLWLRKIG